jgi:preprotein translocase subunit SecD
MKLLKYFFIATIAILILWIDLPRAIPVKFVLFNKKVDFTLQPFSITTTINGQRVQKEFKTQLGLDLKGGSHLVFEADTSKVKPEDLEDALNSARDIVERRVNLFGVSEPSIRTIKSGNIYRITVDLPGVQDVQQAVSIIGQTAQLQFKEMGGDIDPKTATTTPINFQQTKQTGLTGKDVKKATVTFNQQTGEPQVLLEFSETGKKLFAEITQRNIGQPVGIFLDEYIISAPTVQTAITEGNAVISGQFTTDAAKQLAVAINSGALPLPIKLVQQQNIGPTLGFAEVQKSMLAGIVGLAMVMVFMIAYYRRLGIAACLGLIIYGLINLAIFKAVPIVLTLPGIAGFILSIGMAVDSNILIFERIKEEQRKGKSFTTSVRIGFGRALDAIKDANITTMLVAFILFNPLNWEFLPQFGLVRGFALTLGIGVATSLFTGVVITRSLIWLFYKKD